MSRYHSMHRAPVTTEDELNRLLRTIREGGEAGLEHLDKLFGLTDTSGERAKLTRDVVRTTAKGASYIPGIGAEGAARGTRMAMNALENPLLQTGLKYAPLVGVGLSAGDLLLGDESFGNKSMDAALMATGGLIGSAVPVVGTGLGVTGGKMLSDLTQYLLGGGVE